MIGWLREALRTLTTPDKLIALLTTVFGGWWGYGLLAGIIFAETGLLLGFFLPGDSLLFTVGVVAGAGHLNIVLIIAVLVIAAIVGDGVGYQLGKRAGPAIFNRPNSRLFKQEHLLRTKAFYEKHGGKTIIYARFVPIIRTFAPFVAGVAGMSYSRFLSFNIFGGLGWVTSLTLAGYWLGGFPIVQAHFEKIVYGIVLVSVLPIVIEMFKSRNTANRH
jgi:membrane-associated protein